MTYQVLARKWRPKDFASLVGQEHVVRALTHALDQQRLHHAYLFTGTRGVGKTTLSRILAKALNCELGVTAVPCGECKACCAIDAGRCVDYVEMDAASNRGVEEMAALLERAVYAPVDARFKVYMIDEVHMLSSQAFNAMLKTLEEPPAHVKFILATTDPQKIPVTVLSRCLQFNLKQMPAARIVVHLQHVLATENIAFELQALRLLARAAQGSMRDALSLADQAIAFAAGTVSEEAVRVMLGALDQSYMIRMLDAVAARDGAGVLALADEMAMRSLSFATALHDLAGLLHRVAWAQMAPGTVLDEWPDAEDIRRFAARFAPEEVQLYYQIATIGRSELGLAPDEYAGFSMTLLRMLAFTPSSGGGRAAPPPASEAAPDDSLALRGPTAAPAAGSTASVHLGPSRPSATHAMAGLPMAKNLRGPATSPPPAIVPLPQATGAARHEPVRTEPPLAERTGPARAALEALRGASRSTPGRAADACPVREGAAPRPAPAQVDSAWQSAASDTTFLADAAEAALASCVGPAVESRAEPERYVRGANPPAADAEHTLRATAPRGDGGPPGQIAVSVTAGIARVTDMTELRPGISLAVLGCDGDWPALAATLPLKGIAHQLAFCSEAVEVGQALLRLRVPVPQYADAAQVAKLKAVLSAQLGLELDLQVEVGAAACTAAAREAVHQARRQREAEQAIGQDPFIQSLIREFDAAIVPGSIRPLPASERGASSPQRKTGA